MARTIALWKWTLTFENCTILIDIRTKKQRPSVFFCYFCNCVRKRDVPDASRLYDRLENLSLII